MAAVDGDAAMTETDGMHAEHAGRYATALLIVALATATGLPFATVLTAASVSMLYLLGVVAAGVYLGRGPAVTTALASSLAFNFFFTEPRWTFRIDLPSDILTFVALLAIGLVVATLSARMRNNARLARQRAARAVALSTFAEALLGSEDEQQIVDLARCQLGADYDAEVELLVGERAGLPRGDLAPAFGAVAFDSEAVQRVVLTGQGQGADDTSPAAVSQHYLPVRTPHRVLAVLVVAPRDPQSLETDEARTALANHARQLALALDRLDYARRAHEADLAARLEESRQALLAGLSHDLRTPLATLVGASSALLAREPIAATSTRELLDTIHEESQRMARMTDNLLDMARLAGRPAAIRAEWIPIDELVGSARRQLRNVPNNRRIEVRIETPLTEIFVDAMLIERVIVNLLENALKYTAAETPIELVVRRAVKDVQTLLLGVLDRGAGVAAAIKQRAFDTFFRGEPEGPQSGAGLGLALCRVIVELHHGRIWVEDREGGGAAFWVALPQPPEGAPPLPTEALT